MVLRTWTERYKNDVFFLPYSPFSPPLRFISSVISFLVLIPHLFFSSYASFSSLYHVLALLILLFLSSLLLVLLHNLMALNIVFFSSSSSHLLLHFSLFHISSQLPSLRHLSSRSLWLYSPLHLGRFFRFLILYTIVSTPWTGDQPVARPLPTKRTTET
jgi:hypothetical protein